LLFYREDGRWLGEDMTHEGDEVSTLEGFGYKRQCASIDAMVEQFFIRVSRHQDDAQPLSNHRGADS